MLNPSNLLWQCTGAHVQVWRSSKQVLWSLKMKKPSMKKPSRQWRPLHLLSYRRINSRCALCQNMKCFTYNFILSFINCWHKGREFDQGRDYCISVEAKWWGLVYGEASVLVKRTPDGQNLRSLCYSVSHNHIVVMGCETPHVFIIVFPMSRLLSKLCTWGQKRDCSAWAMGRTSSSTFCGCK